LTVVVLDSHQSIQIIAPFAMSLSMNRFRLAQHASGSENQPSGFCGHIPVRKDPQLSNQCSRALGKEAEARFVRL